MPVKQTSEEFKNFDQTMEVLMKVPHSRIKDALEAEKTRKTKKRKAKPSASGRASGAKD
jgi:hypothetical protein